MSITQLEEDLEGDFREDDVFTPRGWLKLAIDEKWKLVKLGDICGPGEVSYEEIVCDKVTVTY